jgi:MFS family permease
MQRMSSSSPVAEFKWASFAIVVAASFLSFLEYGVVMPSMQPYVNSLFKESSDVSTTYSVAMSAFSAGRLVALPLFGWWCDRAAMLPILFGSLVVDAFGNLLCGLAETAGTPYLIVCGRFISGLAAGNGALSMIYVAMTTTTLRRTALMTLTAASASVAVALGPVLTIVIARIKFEIGSVVRFNTYTGPGFLVFTFDVVLAAIVLLWFQSPSLEVVQVGCADPLTHLLVPWCCWVLQRLDRCRCVRLRRLELYNRQQMGCLTFTCCVNLCRKVLGP